MDDFGSLLVIRDEFQRILTIADRVYGLFQHLNVTGSVSSASVLQVLLPNFDSAVCQGGSIISPRTVQLSTSGTVAIRSVDLVTPDIHCLSAGISLVCSRGLIGMGPSGCGKTDVAQHSHIILLGSGQRGAAQSRDCRMCFL